VRDDNPGVRNKRSNSFWVNPTAQDHFIRNAGEVSDFRGNWRMRLVERRIDIRNLRYPIVG
jgi:hypothetical protein